MKSKYSLMVFLINLLYIKQILSLSLENVFGIGDEYNNEDVDSDDMIFKLKSFFDKYAETVKNKIKTVDKIILPVENKMRVKS